jgi:hypothetical protein
MLASVYDPANGAKQVAFADQLTASSISNTPAGNIVATDVQAAINELDTDKQAALGYTPVNKAGDTMSGNLTVSKGSPSVTFINTDNTQYSTSTNKMYQNAPTFASQAGINFGIAVTDTGATSTKFVIDRVDYTGVFSANVFAIDLPTRVATFHGNVTPSLNNSKGLGSSSLYWSNLYATKNYLNSTAIIDGTNAGIIYMTATAASGTAFYAGASTSGISFEINNNNTDAKLAVKSTVAGKAAYVYLQSLGNYRSLRGDNGGGILHFSFGQFGGTQFVIRTNSDGYTGYVDAQALQIDGSQQTTFNPANANSSVYFYPVQIKPTLTQSGTAGYTALLINPTETTTGSGTKLLADFQVGGTSRLSINNYGKVIVTVPAAASESWPFEVNNGSASTNFSMKGTAAASTSNYIRFQGNLLDSGGNHVVYEMTARFNDITSGAQTTELNFNIFESGTAYAVLGFIGRALTLADASNISLGTTTGTKIGTATTQKLGFFNATPVVRPSSTPANATDLTTALALVNDIKSKLVTLGLIA